MSGALLAAFIVSTLLKNSSQSVHWIGVYSTFTFGYSLLNGGISAARRSASSREPNRAIRRLPWVEPLAGAAAPAVVPDPAVAAGLALGAARLHAAATERPAAPSAICRKRRRGRF